jgi:hypothetical protein
LLAFSAEGSCRLIQEKDRRVCQNCSRDANPLPLPRGGSLA